MSVRLWIRLCRSGPRSSASLANRLGKTEGEPPELPSETDGRLECRHRCLQRLPERGRGFGGSTSLWVFGLGVDRHFSSSNAEGSVEAPPAPTETGSADSV